MLHRRAVLAVLLPGFVFGSLAVAQSVPESRPGRVYYIAFLKRDPARKPISKEEGERIQAAHMENIRSMADRGVLVAAGPFDDTPPVISGIFFFATSTIEDARKVAETDPTVVEHRNKVDVLAWRGPAGIGDEYKRLHKLDPNTPVGMGVHPFVILRRSGKSLDENLMARHSAYRAGLRSNGKILAAGAVDGDLSAVEILIFDRIPDEEASSLVADDPAVRQGLLTVEVHRWWCAANVFPRQP
jgi:uncharacterized protein YciI